MPRSPLSNRARTAGAILRSRRKRMRRSIDDIARLTGIASRMVSGIEQGKRVAGARLLGRINQRLGLGTAEAMSKELYDDGTPGGALKAWRMGQGVTLEQLAHLACTSSGRAWGRLEMGQTPLLECWLSRIEKYVPAEVMTEIRRRRDACRLEETPVDVYMRLHSSRDACHAEPGRTAA